MLKNKDTTTWGWQFCPHFNSDLLESNFMSKFDGFSSKYEVKFKVQFDQN